MSIRRPAVLAVAALCIGLGLADICTEHADVLFSCKSGAINCVSRSFVCDGENDCDNGEDEYHCGVDCESNGLFRCAIGHPCIPGSWKCDGDNDCVDGSDETTALCGRKCDGANKFHCGSGECIAAFSVCDGNRDCLDNSDENSSNCHATPEPPCNSTFQFDCKEETSRCISLIWKCDGEDDCDNGIDENACSSPQPAPSQQPLPVSLGPTVSAILQCSDREYKCLDGERCIPYPHRCDSYVDCKDGSDENQETCKTAPRCPPRLQFSCVTTPQCIPWSKHCDGVDDCQDNSDEYGCELTNAPSFLVASCEGMFKCGSGECLSYKRVCDNKMHCGDGSDETNCFIDECANGTASCRGSQTCVDLPTGYDCTCPKGFQITATGCEDIDECASFGYCQQNCSNSLGSFICSCDSGYILRPDQRSCKSESGEAYLLYAHGHEIRSMDLASLQYEKVFHSSQGTISYIGVTFHYQSGMVYFCDFQSHSIHGVPLSGGNVIELYTDVGAPEGLAVDWLNNRLYWTESDRGNVVMGSLDGNKSSRRVIVSMGDKIRGIAVDPRRGVMFWTDWGKWPLVARANMDGSDVRVLINDTDVAKWPNGLTIDLYGEYVFWCDGWYEKIVVMDYEGKKMKTLIQGGIGNIFGLALYDDKLIFSEWRQGKVVISGMLDGSHKYTVASSAVSDVRGIAMYQEQQQPLHDNPCRRSMCSHYCVPSAGAETGFVCMCNLGVPLLNDNATCGRPEVLCDNRYCNLNGDCLKRMASKDQVCLCSKGFYGPKCDWLTPTTNESTPTTSESTPTSDSIRDPILSATSSSGLLNDGATSGHPEVPCDNQYCNGNGDCLRRMDSEIQVCVCNEGFHGSRCDPLTPMPTSAPVRGPTRSATSSSSNKLPVVLGTVFGFLFLVAMVAVIFFFLRHKGAKKEGNFAIPVYYSNRDNVTVRAKEDYSSTSLNNHT
ncbi:low-density lipoprotein receptor-like [Oscarella lobularis]|uniref:low-density lipoprotein receptor-like n=1 Tax=Oscarella lobularis TaxID=121494 RepID=UPI003313A4A3